MFFGGLVVVFGYPLPFLVLGGHWFLLGLYGLVAAGFFMTLKMFLCTQCMNFACPLNGVPDSIRVKFFERNPVVVDAWNVEHGRTREAT